MADPLINNRGNTEHDPCEFVVCTAGDVTSWAALHKGFRDKVVQLLPSMTAGPLKSEVEGWASESEKYSDLSGGISSLWDFGITLNADLIEQIISDAKEGRRLLGLMREQLNLPGGEDVGAAEGTEDRDDLMDVLNPFEGMTKEIRLFVGGAVLTGLAYGAYRLYKKGGL